MRTMRTTVAILALVIGMSALALLAGPLPADEQCGPGFFGAGDPRVPYTICTPWPKPTYEEWNSGWHWAPPSWPMTSVPVGLSPAQTSSGFSIDICYLPRVGATQHELNRTCSGYSIAATITLAQWCQMLRSLETATKKVPWLEIEGVCGQPAAVTQVTTTYRNGRVFKSVTTMSRQ